MNIKKPDIIICIILSYISAANADYKDDIAYTRLANELTSNTPDGSGVIAIHSEASTKHTDHDKNTATKGLPVYLPDLQHKHLSKKLILDITGYKSGSYSAHATGIAKYFYGKHSIAPAIETVQVYWADQWLQSNILNFGKGKPLSSTARIGNHSWVGNVEDPVIISSILRRFDWMISTDECMHIVGTRNSKGINDNIFSSAYNVLAVGKTNGNHTTGSPSIDNIYPKGRNRTEIIAPFATTSIATSVVSATAALLIETGHSKPELSTDTNKISEQIRNGDTIFNAERQEVIKAALLAGANRITKNTHSTANLIDYRVMLKNQTRNGLDARFGAGQLNVYNSYHIIAGGEQNSQEDDDKNKGKIKTSGFDYDPYFGGANNTNSIASYYFSTGDTPKKLTASLVWNIRINGGKHPRKFNGNAIFYDLDLYLYDVTDKQSLIIRSNSLIDNSENIWESLHGNRSYLMQVAPKSGQAAFNWDYALAWRLTSETKNKKK